MLFLKHPAKLLINLFNKGPFLDQFTKSISLRFFRFKFTGIKILLLTLSFLLLPSDNSIQNDQVSDSGWVSIAGELDKISDSDAKFSGKVVYQRPDGIYTINIDDKKPQRLVEYGTYPRWSPDGKQVAFVAGNKIMLVSSRGGKAQAVATATQAKAVCFNPDGNSLLFTDGIYLRVVDLKQRKIKTLLKGYEFLEIDVAEKGFKVVATVRTSGGFSVLTFDLRTKKNRSVSRGCSASLSPEGNILTVNDPKHLKLALYQWDSFERIGQINAPSGKKFDNHFWSNSKHWIVYTAEGEGQDIYIHHIPSNTSYPTTSSGDCDRGDLFVPR